MTCYFPETPALSQRLDCADLMLVLCFCAAWCDTCQAYQARFEGLSAAHPDACFIWVDIEDYPELLGDEDVENFPTIAIVNQAKVRFMGTVLPHIEHLDRLISAMREPGKSQQTALPESLMTQLKGAHS
jgi:thiol-disulfide isomerase/thioredoxin